jgi:hypothetical protein
MLQSIRKQKLVRGVFFNDKELIKLGFVLEQVVTIITFTLKLTPPVRT